MSGITRVPLKLVITLAVQFLFLLTILQSCSTYSEDPIPEGDDVLWYEKAAGSWVEALPLGNGKLGVMVFGNTSTERIQLNDDSMWPLDNEKWDNPQGSKEDLEYIRQLLFDGQNAKADSLVVEKFSRKKVVRSHQTMGDLFIDFDHDSITDYRRQLDLANATATVSYKVGGKELTERVFVSHPHKAIIVHLSSEAENGLSANIRLSRPEDEGFATAKTRSKDQDMLIMQGEVTQRGAQFNSEPFPLTEGVKFETRLKAINLGGSIESSSDQLELKNVKEVTLVLVSNSSYYFDNYKAQNISDLESILSEDLKSLYKAHVQDFRSFYDRLSLDLQAPHAANIKDNSDRSDTNKTETNPAFLPTDTRLQRVKDGALDVGLEALLFQYGRYLLISSSRQGSNPANLQGLWNQHIAAPWNADYHLNINLQMNYWLADVTNLSELNDPLFKYVDRLVENGKRTANQNFACQGSFMPHATDLWAPTWMRAPRAYWGSSMGAGGWMMQHYWQHYEYTRDEDFLRERAFPAIQEVAHFYSDWLIEDPRDGSLISAPSTSPENRFFNEKGQQVAICLGSAMDQQVIREVFDNYLSACEILELDSELSQKIKEQREQLRPGFVIGPDGRILEWDRAYSEPEPGHRHMSHLYGFHPGNMISKDAEPELFEAVRKTLDYRLANGGAGTGWSRAWLINCSARLMDGQMAHEHIQLFMKRSLSSNLFDLHPPFQIDGNFGFSAGVAEMLLQSYEENTIRLLPALPEAWETGSVSGLKARGGLIVDISWKDGNLVKASITAEKTDLELSLKYRDTEVALNLNKGETYTYEDH